MGNVYMTPEEYVVRLLEAANKKCALLKDILFISQAQSRSITEDGVENLEKLIDEKQVKIDEINKIDEGFAEDFNCLKQVLGVKSLAELKDLKDRGVGGIKDLQDVIGEIMALIREISELEKSNSLKAKKRLENLSTKVRQVNQGKQLNAAYMPSPVKLPSYFIDKKR